MNITYQVNTSELNESFLNSIKSIFPNKSIEISIWESTDETEYLLKNKKNADRLLKSINNIKKGKKLIELNLSQLKQIANEENSI
ncbi:MAG: hypothetical protein A2046_12225 [Bacteroidetes bacterium GWA2_30_7]|nr:MAG: hypothetical protein A2046_12225 [Bacteroidetes bacterium GWA2_30_7]